MNNLDLGRSVRAITQRLNNNSPAHIVIDGETFTITKGLNLLGFKLY